MKGRASARIRILTASACAPARAALCNGEAAARGALGEEAFSRAVERGRSMSLQEVVAYAVDERPQAAKPRASARPEPRTPLTRRELEIARLITEGLTSQPDGEQALHLSERTVTTHVTNMLNRLGLNSRIQLARWVAGADGHARPRDT